MLIRHVKLITINFKIILMLAYVPGDTTTDIHHKQFETQTDQQQQQRCTNALQIWSNCADYEDTEP